MWKGEYAVIQGVNSEGIYNTLFLHEKTVKSLKVGKKEIVEKNESWRTTF